jgi:septum site-determining protein MinD
MDWRGRWNPSAVGVLEVGRGIYGWKTIRNNSMRVIAVISGKGGVGKTTLVGNLGVIASMKFGKNVLLADCNMTASHLGISLGMDHYHATLNHVLRGHAHVNEAIYNHSSGARVLPSSIAFKDMDGVDISLLGGVIDRIRNFGMVDTLILDCAPGLGREVMAALNSSDEVLIVANPYITSVMDVIKCSHAIDASKSKVSGIVLNMVGSSKHELSHKEISSIAGLPVIAKIPMDKEVLKSTSLRMPVFMMNPLSKASKSIEVLADSVFR